MSKTESADDGGVEYKNMRVPADAWEKAQEAKEEAGETWEEYILRCVDEGPADQGLEERDVRKIVRDMVVDGALR